MYNDIDTDANSMETEFQASLEQLEWFIKAYLANAGIGSFEESKATFTFNRSMMMNQSEIITNVRNSSGLISDETILAHHPWVTDVDEELERLKKQKEENLEQYGFGAGNPFEQKKEGDGVEDEEHDYWKARMLAVEARGYKIGHEAYKESEQAFKLAERELLRQIEKWIWRIADENGISYAEAKKLLTAGELEEFRWDVNEYIEKGKENAADAAWLHELENASARAHISRLEAMKLQLREYLEEAFNVENKATETALAKIYESEYYHTAYEVQKGIGVGYEIGGINEKAISRAVKKPWAADGKNFSSRIWGNKAKMVGELEQELTRQIITGDSPDAAIEALSKYVKDGVGNAKQKAGTLIMTESAAIGNQAQHDSYAALGVKEYEVIETLDTHTCAQCGEMDSKHFPMDQFMIGVTAPPFHPNCRGCTAPYFDDEFQPQQRAARDPETGKTVMVDKMTYEEWKYKFLPPSTTGKSLSEPLEFEYNKEKGYIPQHAVITNAKVIAGRGSENVFRKAAEYANKLGGTPEEWSKFVGKVTSDKYVFDVHWYERKGEMYRPKIKTQKERR